MIKLFGIVVLFVGFSTLAAARQGGEQKGITMHVRNANAGMSRRHRPAIRQSAIGR